MDRDLFDPLAGQPLLRNHAQLDRVRVHVGQPEDDARRADERRDAGRVAVEARRGGGDDGHDDDRPVDEPCNPLSRAPGAHLSNLLTCGRCRVLASLLDLADRDPQKRLMRFGVRRLERAFETGRILPFLMVAIAALAFASGALMWIIDRDDFPTLGVALWWAVTTVTTVGYGDVVPKARLGGPWRVA